MCTLALDSFSDGNFSKSLALSWWIFNSGIFPVFRCSEFCRMVKRIYIYSYEEAKSLTPKAKLPAIGGDTGVKPDPSKLSAESDVPQSDSDNSAPVAADKD